MCSDARCKKGKRLTKQHDFQLNTETLIYVTILVINNRKR